MLIQSQCTVSLNENNSLHEDKVYERYPSYKIYESLDQVNSKLTVRGGVISGIRLMNEEVFFVCIHWKKHGRYGISPYNIIFDDKKGCWRWNLWCTPVKVHHHMNTDQLDKKELYSSISDICLLQSIIGENNSDGSFKVLCHSWKKRYFGDNSIKITFKM